VLTQVYRFSSLKHRPSKSVNNLSVDNLPMLFSQVEDLVDRISMQIILSRKLLYTCTYGLWRSCFTGL